jgi:hypothetical protein
MVAVANATGWGVSAWRLSRNRPEPAIHRTRHVLLWLSAAYALGCAFRSVFPMIDVPRLCLHDGLVSRIFVGRLVATAAEMCFVAQWALLLAEAGAVRASRAVLPLILFAELLSWLAVLTTNDLFHAAENSVWTVTAALAVVFLASRWRYEGKRGRQVIYAAIGCGVAYILFMAGYVLPMYFLRWQADTAAGREYLSLAQGLGAVLQHCTIDRNWSRWWQDAAWLTPYFTLAVWLSLLLPHVPSLRGKRRPAAA